MRSKDLYILGDISRGEYNRRCDGLEAEIRGAKAKADFDAPDLRNLQQILKRLDHIVELIKEGIPVQQREAIDALIERAEEKDRQFARVIPREWARTRFQA